MKKYILITIIAGVLIISNIVTLSIIKSQKKRIADAEYLIEIQHKTIERLGELDAVRCNITVNLSNKTTFGSIKQSDVNIVADQVLHYTRRELLNNDTICTTSQH